MLSSRRVYFFLMVLCSGACQSPSQQTTPAASPAPALPYHLTSSVREVMHSIVATSAQGLWDSVGRISNSKGTVDLAPKTDADWEAVHNHAVTLVESADLLMIPGRRIAPPGAKVLTTDDAVPGSELPPDEVDKLVRANWPVWIGMATALHESAKTLLAATEKRDVAALERDGSELDAVCESCHVTFWYPTRTAK